MSILDFLNKIRLHQEQPAMIFNEQVYNYNWLCQQEDFYFDKLSEAGVGIGSIVVLIADYSPESLSVLMALMRLSAIIMPITNNHYEKKKEHLDIIQSDFIIELDTYKKINISKLNSQTEPQDLISELRSRKTPGLIILSSGSTGNYKAILHDLSLLIKGVRSSKNKLKVISFLLFDHIGGINTVLNTLISGNCLVVPSNRTPKAVAESIHRNNVEVLITSPSFLNLMLIGNVFKSNELNCLKQINYGSEVMPSILLERLAEKLPNTKFNQAYGLSEFGVIRTKTNDQGSNLITIDDINVDFRVRDDKLEIKSKNSMLGYLNSATPFTDDGWFMTGDVVEMVGSSLRILGRDSDLINIGGEKVFPAEIENIILQLPEVEDVSVSGENNLILGNIIVANIKLKFNVNHLVFKNNVRQYCLNKMPKFKVPQKFKIVSEITYGERFKKIRTNHHNL